MCLHSDCRYFVPPQMVLDNMIDVYKATNFVSTHPMDLILTGKPKVALRKGREAG
jgi:hypothetical protein